MKDNNQVSERHIIIGEVISESWSAIKGIKGKVWLAILIMIAIIFILNLLVHTLFRANIENPPFYLTYIVIPIITNAIIAPFYAGAVMTCVKHLRNEATDYGTPFSYLHQYFTLALAMAIIGLLGSLFMIVINAPAVVQHIAHHKTWLDIVAGLYSLLIYTFFILTVPLIADKNQRPLAAMGKSCKLIAPRWLKILAIIVITYLTILVSTIPLLLAAILGNDYIIILGGIITVAIIIWVLPFLFMVQANIYHHICP